MGPKLAALIATCAPQVHPTTMYALIAVESAGNPYAISINYPTALAGSGVDLPEVAQPRSVNDALHLIWILQASGLTVSVGLSQINAEHLKRWHVPVTALLDPCTNLRLAQRVLLDCQADIPQRGESLAALLSCFNSGNGTTGIANGYAARVYAAAVRLTHSPQPRRAVP